MKKPIEILALAAMLSVATGCGNNKKTADQAAETLPEVTVTKAIAQDVV